MASEMRNNMTHGVETMAWANDVPWHGLGRKVNSDLTPDQILLHADLDWSIFKKQVQWTAHDNVIMSSDKYFSLVREAHERIDGTKVPEQIVGTQWVTDQYNIIQNSRQAKFFKEYIDAGMATMETAISLFGGRIVLLMAKTNNSFELAGGDKIEQYIYFANYHSGRDKARIRSSNIRVVCNNTLSASLRSGAKVDGLISHRVDFTNDLEKQFKEDHGIATSQMTTYQEKLEKLASKKLKENDLVNYLLLVYQPELLRDKNFSFKKFNSDTDWTFNQDFKVNANVKRSFNAFHDIYEANGKIYPLKNTGNDLKSMQDDNFNKGFQAICYNESHLKGGSSDKAIQMRTQEVLLSDTTVSERALDVGLSLVA